MTDATQRLNALLAGLLELDASHRPLALRQHLEYGLVRLQRLEEEHYSFLGECAVLAAQNMQDLRLRDLEQRVGKLEHPPEPSWGEMILKVVAELVIQLTTLELFEGAIAAAAYLGALRTLPTAVRAAWLASAPTTAPAQIIADEAAFSAERETVNAAAQQLTAIVDTVIEGKTKVPPGGYQITVGTGVVRKVVTLDDWIGANQEVADRGATLDELLELSREAIAGHGQRPVEKYQLALTQTGNEAIARYSEQWHAALEGHPGHIAFKAVENAVDTFTEWLGRAAAAEAEAGRPYVTSDTTGRFLNFASGKRMEVAEYYAALTLYVRYADDRALVKDPRIALLAQMIEQVLPAYETLRMLGQAARPALVLGFEGALWYEYLRANGVLEVSTNQTYMGAPDLAVGTFVDGFVIQGPAVDHSKDTDWVRLLPYANLIGIRALLWLRSYSANFYCGVPVLSEWQAETLYHRFAEPYFADPANVASAHLPFPYDPTRYSPLVAEQPRLWEGQLTDGDRRQRLDEMRLLVIMYFRQFGTGDPDRRLDAFLGEGAGLSVATWASGGSTGIVPPLADPDEATRRALEATREPLRALLDATGIGTVDDLRLSCLELDSALTDLNQDIQAYQLLAHGTLESDDTVGGRTKDELYREISQEQTDLDLQYRDLLAAAGDDEVASAALGERYGAAVDAIVSWTPDGAWIWYGESPPNQP